MVSCQMVGRNSVWCRWDVWQCGKSLSTVVSHQGCQNVLWSYKPRIITLSIGHFSWRIHAVMIYTLMREIAWKSSPMHIWYHCWERIHIASPSMWYPVLTLRALFWSTTRRASDLLKGGKCSPTKNEFTFSSSVVKSRPPRRHFVSLVTKGDWQQLIGFYFR